MSRAEVVSSRPLVDKLMLIAIVACLGVGVVRVGLAAAAFPAALRLNRQSDAIRAAHIPIAETPLLDQIVHNGVFVWWGTRNIPYRAGGSYVSVMSHIPASHWLGCAIGVVAQRANKKHVVFARVIVPSDREALYGGEPGTLQTLADGTEVRTRWGPLSEDSAYFSDVPVITKQYNPVLTAKQASQIEASAGLKQFARGFEVGAAPAGPPTTWILYAKPGISQEYVLIPAELSPMAGAL